MDKLAAFFAGYMHKCAALPAVLPPSPITADPATTYKTPRTKGTPQPGQVVQNSPLPTTPSNVIQEGPSK